MHISNNVRIVVWHCAGRRPTLHDSMPYTWAVVYELMRYVTIVPLANRLTLEDTTIAGHRLPAGTIVMVHFWAMHHDSDFWDDPDVFQPERFLDPASGQLLPADHPNRTHLMCHGAGLRSCPGALYSLRRLVMYAAYLAHTFDIQPDDAKPLTPCDPRTYPMSNLLVVPSYRVKLIARQQPS
jgi:cytochrome P450